MRNNLLAFFVIMAVNTLPSFSQEAPSEKNKRTPIELEAIEIKGKIQEPTLLYILDQPELEIDPYHEDQVDFVKKIFEPIHDDAL